MRGPKAYLVAIAAKKTRVSTAELSGSYSAFSDASILYQNVDRTRRRQRG